MVIINLNCKQKQQEKALLSDGFETQARNSVLRSCHRHPLSVKSKVENSRFPCEINFCTVNSQFDTCNFSDFTIKMAETNNAAANESLQQEKRKKTRMLNSF